MEIVGEKGVHHAELEKGGDEKRGEKRKVEGEASPGQKNKKARHDVKPKVAPETRNKAFEKVFGKDARPEIEIRFKEPKCDLKVRDLQNLVLWAIGDGSNPTTWLFLKNKALVNKVVVVMIDSLSEEHYKEAVARGLFPKIRSIFDESKIVSTKGAGAKNRVFHGLPIFLQVPIPNKFKSKATHDEFPGLEYYTLGPHDLIENEYPSETDPKCASYLRTYDTDAYKIDETNFKEYGYLALDCEMCRTAEGLELARVSFVDENETVIYDTFVKPENPIQDYLTKYSGIAAKDLEGVTTTLADVHAKLRTFLKPETILLGHSLENDFHALKIIHKNVVDTSLLFPNGQEGRKNSLRFLSQKFLGNTIQDGGHDSTVDAQTALRLVKLKIKNGPNFGRQEEETESIFNRLDRNDPPRKSAIVDIPMLCQRYTNKTKASFFASDTDNEIVAHTISACNNPELNFIVSHLHSVENHLKAGTTFTSHLDGIDSAFNFVDDAVARIYESLPADALFVVFTGHGDIHVVKRLEEIKTKSQKNMSSTLWLPEQEAALTQLVEKARAGLSFFAIKK